MTTTARNRLLSVWLFVFCPAIIVFAGTRVDAQMHSSGGKLFVFKVSDEVAPERIQEVARALASKLRVRVVSGPLLSSYRLLMVGPTSDDKLSDTVKSDLQELLPGARITSVPVWWDAEKNPSIPTGLMIVQFRPEVKNDQASQLLRSLKLTVTEAPGSTSPGRYVVKNTDGDIDGLKNAQAALSDSKIVSSAALDVLTPMRP